MVGETEKGRETMKRKDAEEERGDGEKVGELGGEEGGWEQRRRAAPQGPECWGGGRLAAGLRVAVGGRLGKPGGGG